jgi:hypothetical protein
MLPALKSGAPGIIYRGAPSSAAARQFDMSSTVLCTVFSRSVKLTVSDMLKR